MKHQAAARQLCLPAFHGDFTAHDRDGKYTVYWYERHPVRSDWVYDIRVTVKTGRDFSVEEYCFINR